MASIITESIVSSQESQESIEHLEDQCKVWEEILDKVEPSLAFGKPPPSPIIIDADGNKLKRKKEKVNEEDLKRLESAICRNMDYRLKYVRLLSESFRESIGTLNAFEAIMQDIGPFFIFEDKENEKWSPATPIERASKTRLQVLLFCWTNLKWRPNEDGSKMERNNPYRTSKKKTPDAPLLKPQTPPYPIPSPLRLPSAAK